MRWLLAGLLAVLLVVTQTTLMEGHGPDLAMLFTLGCAYLGEVPAGSLAGMWSGLLMGAAWGNFEGVMAAVYTLVGWTAELSFRRWGKGMTVVALTAGLTTLLGIGVEWALLYLTGCRAQDALTQWWEKTLWSVGLLVLLRGR